MTDEKKKMTAQGSSVGADGGQSISKTYENSIPTSGQKSNDEIVNSQDGLEEMYRKIQRMTDPRYLHTLTMTELFQTTYKSRPPVVEGSALRRGIYPCRSAQNRQVLPGGSDCLPCQYRAGFVGI